MASSLSRSAVDALGKRLARAVVADPRDLQQLFAHQRECIEALEQTLRAIAETVQHDSPRGVPVHVTHRVKTVETLIDKLRRGTALSRMQDLVGIRVVGDFGLSEQDELMAGSFIDFLEHESMIVGYGPAMAIERCMLYQKSMDSRSKYKFGPVFNMPG